MKTKTSALKAQIPVIPFSNSSKFYRVRSDKHILAQYYRFFPLTVLLALECGFILIGAILPLRGLWFETALLTQFSNWVLLPTHILFPGRAIAPTLLNTLTLTPPSVLQSWKEIGALLASFVLILLLYLLAIRYLPQQITRRYILLSVLLFGITCVSIPVVTSQDLYSYIIYARMSIIYHLNPLTTSPKIIRGDPVYTYLYWVDQPSAYGPVWTIITGSLQWLTSIVDIDTVVPMVLALRLLSLVAHICSTLLVWSIAGHLQRITQKGSSLLRTQATLAFAWNPLLIFEACVNAHNDTFILLFVLLAIWFLVNTPSHSMRSYSCAAMMLALATCLKVNIALLMPGLLLFLWAQPHRLRTWSMVLAIYVFTIVALYAPFWQNGAILNILRINPGTYRDINTISEFLTHLYNSIIQGLGFPRAADIGSPAEFVTHTLSTALFVLIYGVILWKTLSVKYSIRTPAQLLRWMALVWFLYCMIGSPWSWPWYTITFFGLFSLVESIDGDDWHKKPFFGFLYLPLAVRLLAFSMLSLYCFYAWAPFASYIPWLPNFRWAWLRGLWIWTIPLLAVFLRSHSHITDLFDPLRKDLIEEKKISSFR